MRWVGNVARVWEGRGAYRVFVGKPEGRRPIEKPKRRWEVHTKMNLKEVELMGTQLLDLVQGIDRCQAVVNAVINLRPL